MIFGGASWRRRYGAALILLAACVLFAAGAAARPGGGQTYSGSSSSSSGSGYSSSGSGYSSSGSGSSGGGEAFGALIGLCFEYPPLGILVLGITLAVFFLKSRNESTASWDAGAERLKRAMNSAGEELEAARQREKSQSELRNALEGIRRLDPDFSVVLFEDFVYALFSEAHRARGSGTLDRLGPWLSEKTRAALGSHKSGEVKDIVIGALRYVEIIGVTGNDPKLKVLAEIEANYTETRDGGEAKRLYVVERWTFVRKKGAHTRPRAQVTKFECPNCGAALEAIQGRECSYCKKTVDTGEFDWVVRGWERPKVEQRAPELGGYQPERGTERPTVVDPQAKSRWERLTQGDKAVTWPAFLARLDRVFFQLTQGWNENAPLEFRAYVSDGVFQSLSYWLEAYQRQGLRNVNDEARITAVQIARVVLDAQFHSVTVRVFATGHDYTIDAKGKLVGGSKTEERRYSEYWTLIRGAARRGAPRADKNCPNCGAPLVVEMTGSCTHCNAKVTSGDFDWVLSRIEQDDSY